jgi:transcriptional regulator with XRE-family HTH domain
MMLVQKLRLQHSWSQEELATISGLSVRTIQRIEQGQAPGLESLKALAAIFEVDVLELRNATNKETTMPAAHANHSETEEMLAFAKVRKLKGFYLHVSVYFVVILFLVINNWFTTGFDPFWAYWPAMGWGLGLALHAIWVFQPFPFIGPDWEKRQIEKELGRKL